MRVLTLTGEDVIALFMRRACARKGFFTVSHCAKAHSWTSPQWHDLVSGSNVTSFQHDEGAASTWLDGGYYFGGRSFAQFVNAIPSLTNAAFDPWEGRY